MLLTLEPLPELVDALVEAAKDDPLGAKRWKGREEPNHPDGWGYATLVEGSVREYRSKRAIWEDLEEVSYLKKVMRGPTLVHVRKTSISGTKEFLQNVQPVNVSNVVWVGYNGTIDPKSLEAPRPLKDLMERGLLADTAAVAWAVLENYSEDPYETAKGVYEWLKEAVPEDGGAAITFLDPLGKGGFAWLSKAGDPELSYYRLYILKGKKAVASSTVALKHGGEWVEAPNFGSL